MLEINQHGYLGQRNYPNGAFWKLAGDLGFSAVVGVDAHHPAELLDEDRIGWCIRLAEKCGVRLLKTLDVKPRA